jgi:hypothetical protein
MAASDHIYDRFRVRLALDLAALRSVRPIHPVLGLPAICMQCFMLLCMQ